MCDTLCVTGRGRTLFGKNSDRPPSEVQLTERHPERRAGGRLRTQYIEIEDAGALALVGSRPSWLWGFEHGLNDHRVAIGNEAVHTIDRPGRPSLIGMDLVRLGLERARTAEAAVDIITDLLERHGQGGVCNQVAGISYCSSFLIADPGGSWVVETSGTTWAAKPFADGTAISNRISLREDWTKASGDVPLGADFDGWRDAAADTGHADVRRDASLTLVSTRPDAAAVARHLRDHAGAAPGARVSVCMHVADAAATTSSMIAELPQDPTEPVRAWAAPGSPCVSVYVPMFPPAAIPPILAEPRIWARFAALRDRVEADPAALEDIRGVLDPVEAGLWEDADAAADDAAARLAFVVDAGRRITEALGRWS